MSDRTVGYTCYQRDFRPGACYAAIEAKTYEEADLAASQSGWVIGLDTGGQAHYACPDHAEQLIDPSPIRPWRKESTDD